MSNIRNLQMVSDIISDLSDELEADLSDAHAYDVVASKVENAYREVRAHRRYPSSYDEEDIESDMEQFYSQVRNIALYDFNQIGAEFQSVHNENSTNRSYIDRRQLFTGIYPISRC